MRQWDLIGLIGNFNLHVIDVLFVFTMIYCAVSAVERWRYSPLEYLNVLLCGILIVNFARGIAVVSVALAGVHFRYVAGFVAASLFVFFMPRRIDIDWVFDKVVLLGWGIVFLSIARLTLGLNTFVHPEAMITNPEVFEGRFLDSGATLMLGEASLIVLYRIGALPVGRKRRRMTAILLVFLAVVLISNQRTATSATLVGIGAVIAAFPRQRRKVVFPVGGFVIVAASAAVYGAWIAAGGDLSSFSLQESQYHAKTDYEWRLAQWQDALDLYSQAGLVDEIIGMPLSLAQSIAFRIDRERLQFTAHSEYVALLMNSGLLGVALFVSMLVVAVGKGIIIMRSQTGGNIRTKNVGLAIAIIVSNAVFSYAYMIPNEQGLLLAVALRVIATAPRFHRRSMSMEHSRLEDGGSWIRSWRRYARLVTDDTVGFSDGAMSAGTSMSRPSLFGGTAPRKRSIGLTSGRFDDDKIVSAAGGLLPGQQTSRAVDRTYPLYERSRRALASRIMPLLFPSPTINYVGSATISPLVQSERRDAKV
jgi:hypothetical protein